METNVEKKKKLPASNIDYKMALLIGIIVVFAAAAYSINPRFLAVDNILNILYQYSVVGVMAVGMMMIIITGGIDLSMGYGIAFGAVVCGTVFTNTGNAVLAIMSAILSCTALGVVNGFIITQLKINHFVTTLATMTITQGLLNIVGSGQRLMLEHELFDLIGKTKILGKISVETVIMIVVMIIGAIFLSKTKMGAYIYAIGSNEKNAQLGGINTGKYKWITYSIGGFCVGIASVLLGSKLTLVTQSSAGSAQLMDCIAAVVIGGTSMSGGSGKMAGTFLGVIFIGMVSNMLTLLKVPGTAQDLFKGLIIILALLLNTLSVVLQNRSEKKRF